MEPLLDRVIDFCKKHYAGLKYDNQDFFERHVCHVVEKLIEHGGTENQVAAAYMHDIIEDTPVTYEDVVREFGVEIADIVECVTDKPGKNRLERHLNTYWLLRKNDDAIKVKLADRMSNMERSIGTKFDQLYRKEYVAFKFALYDGNNIDMWEKLDDLYERLKGK